MFQPLSNFAEDEGSATDPSSLVAYRRADIKTDDNL